MKKIIIFIIIGILLTSCSKAARLEKKLNELGYNEQEVSFITSLEQEKQEMFLNEYNDVYLVLSEINGFKEDNFFDYLKYRGVVSDEKLIELVNKNILNDDNADKLKQLYENEYYIAKNEQLYLQYLDKYETVRKTIEIVNTNRYKDYFTDIVLNDVSKDYLMLVNKYYTLPADYAPDDIINTPAEYGRGQMRLLTFNAFEQLHADALKMGYNIIVASGYRSYDYQVGLYNKYLQTDPQEIVDTYSARPGLSEHQTGLCLDVTIPGYTIEDFYKTDASKWLAENCHKYGFIIRFPKDKEDITGYQWEPWHIRYIGEKAATEVYQRGITFDEYYARFVEDYE